jgi:hypothetical protein
MVTLTVKRDERISVEQRKDALRKEGILSLFSRNSVYSLPRLFRFRGTGGRAELTKAIPRSHCPEECDPYASKQEIMDKKGTNCGSSKDSHQESKREWKVTRTERK